MGFVGLEDDFLFQAKKANDSKGKQAQPKSNNTVWSGFDIASKANTEIGFRQDHAAFNLENPVAAKPKK